MALLKETQITDRRFSIALDDDDDTKFIATLSANTRDNEGTIITSYVQDVSSVVTPTDMQTLAPLFERGMLRVMTERNITEADLIEGAGARATKRVEEQTAREVQAEEAQERLDAEFATRKAAQDAVRNTVHPPPYVPPPPLVPLTGPQDNQEEPEGGQERQERSGSRRRSSKRRARG